MPNPANTPAQQDERIPGLPDLPAGADRATLTIPVYYPGTNKTHQAPLVAGDGATTSNAVVGGPKFVQYRDSRLNGVPATALTLDRLKPATIVPGTEATVQNPANTPLSITEPPKTYVATLVGAGAAGAVMVPRYIGAAVGDTVPITWQELVVAAAGDSAPNKNKTPYKPVIFLTQADAIAAGRPDCATLEGLDPLTLCTGTIARVDLYPGASGTELILLYDPQGPIRAFIDGNFQRYYGLTQDGLNPMSWVKKGSLAAALAGITRYSATYDRWVKDETMKIDFNGTDAFFSAVAAGGPFAAPTAAGVGTADWTPAAKPLPQDLSPIVAQHTQQLATIAVQSSPVYGFLEAGGAPVGYTSIDDAVADPRQKTSQAFNTATLVLTQSNPANGSGWAYATAALGRTLQLAEGVALTLPGSDSGTLTFQDFYIESAPGARNGKVRLLTNAPNTTPPALLPRLSGYCGKPLEFVNGGAALLSGYYTGITGTGTAFVIEPFNADNVAATVKVVRVGGTGSGTVKTINGVAPDTAGNVVLPQNDIYNFSQPKRDQVFGMFTSASQFKAVDLPLQGDTSTGIGSRIPDLTNGDLYELFADRDNPIPDPANPGKLIGTPTWLRTSFS